MITVQRADWEGSLASTTLHLERYQKRHTKASLAQVHLEVLCTPCVGRRCGRGPCDWRCEHRQLVGSNLNSAKQLDNLRSLKLRAILTRFSWDLLAGLSGQRTGLHRAPCSGRSLWSVMTGEQLPLSVLCISPGTPQFQPPQGNISYSAECTPPVQQYLCKPHAAKNTHDKKLCTGFCGCLLTPDISPALGSGHS